MFKPSVIEYKPKWVFILIYTVLFFRDYCEQNANDEVEANMYLYYLVASKEVDWVLGIIQIIVQCSNFRFYRVQNYIPLQDL